MPARCGAGAVAGVRGLRGYSAQWLAVIGFLPTIYAQSGLPTAYAAVATALAAAVNMVGNIASGRLLQRGVAAPVLLQCGYVAMAVGAVVAFAPWASAGAEVAHATPVSCSSWSAG